MNRSDLLRDLDCLHSFLNARSHTPQETWPETYCIARCRSSIFLGPKWEYGKQLPFLMARTNAFTNAQAEFSSKKIDFLCDVGTH